MKKIGYLISIVLLLSGCYSATSYSTLSRNEKKLIANYISRNGITVVDELPSDEEFAQNEKLYYAVNGYENFYYRLEKRGDTQTDSVKATESIVMRYKQYTLEEYADTVSNWSTQDNAYPTTFLYATDYTHACTAWHVAVFYMGYSGSECKIIVPSRLGLEAEQSTVTPYGYHLKMLIKR